MNKTPSPNMNDINTSMNGIHQTKQQGRVKQWWPLLLVVALIGAGAYFFLKPATWRHTCRSNWHGKNR
jgi:hypothetical protein